MTARPERRYYALRAVSTPGFMMPVSTLFLVANGVSYATLGLAGAVSAAVIVLAEVPTGYVGDRLGRRATVALSQFLFAAYPLVLVLEPNRAGTLTAFAVLGLAETLQSGAVSAWCYDALDAAGRADEYTAVAGRGSAIRFATLAVTAVVGGLLYGVQPEYPIYAAVAMGGFGVVFAASLSATGESADRSDAGTDADADGGPLGPLEALGVVREFLWSREVRAFLVLVAGVSAAARSIRAFVQPVAVSGLEPLLAGASIAGYAIPETAILGVAYAGFGVVASVASDRASDVEAALGTAGAVFAVTLLDGAVMLLPLLDPVLILPAMALHRGLVSVFAPVKNAYLNEQIDGVGRATVLSAASLVMGLAKVPVTIGSGVLGDAAGPVVAIAALGVLLLTLTVGVHALTRPVVEGEARPAPAD